MAAVVQATPVITMGDHVLQQGLDGQTIDIMVQGDPGDVAAGTNLFLTVAGGGQAGIDAGFNGAKIGPRVSGMDLESPGFLFSDNNTGIQNFTPSNYDQAFFGSILTNSGTVEIPGTPTVLGRVTIDTSGVAPGVYAWEAYGVIPDTISGLLNPDGSYDLSAQWINGTITIEGDGGEVFGDSETNPILPDGYVPGESLPPWHFTQDETWAADNDGYFWFDPTPANGFVYEADPGTEFLGISLPSDAVVDDGNDIYNVLLGDGSKLIMAPGESVLFGAAQTWVRVTNIIPEVDADMADAFPTGFVFNTGSSLGFTMTPLPEPSTFVLAALGLVGLVGLGWRRRN
jgi:hypothetical protein